VFVPRRTARQLETMIEAGERVAEADLLIIEPDVTAATFAAGLPTHLLGTFTTFHPPGTPRSANIRRLAALLDGTLVAPGAVLSVNDVSGPRRCGDGFVMAGTIIRGELVDTCGGGISQFGTTLLNAGFFAGLPLEQWRPHSFFIARYPAGREATLTYPELDVRLRNDSDAWMVLRTATTPGSVTASLYGVPRWQEVIATHEPWRDPTLFPEVVRTASELAPGTSRVVQAGGDGFTVDVRRTRVPFTGTAATVERWRTVYVPQVRIVEVSESASLSPDDAPAAAGPPAAGAGANGD
jgi:vancomycin resistance protein YoaR